MANSTKQLTPSQCMANIIKAGMAMRDENAGTLAKKLNMHRNSITLDLREPERIPLWRLWLYFAVLDIPVETVLQPIANQIAGEMIAREKR